MEIDIDDNEEGDPVPSAESLQSLLMGSARSQARGQSPSQASTKSISGSFFESVEENGRTYANQAYFLPNDDDEETRHSILHQVYIGVLAGRTTLHRIKENVASILDIGAAPGDWAIAVAEQFPAAEIVATDLVPYEPAGLPPNLYFQIDDAREEWTYSDPFDYMHIRGMGGAFADWTHVYAQASKHLVQNGVLEVADIGPVRYGRPAPNSYLSIFTGACNTAAEAAGISLELDHLRKTFIEKDSDLRMLRTISVDVPVGQWHPDPQKASLGKMALVATLEGLEAQSLRLLTKHLAWTADAVRELCGQVKQEILDPTLQATVTCTFVVVRKLDLGD